MSDKENHLGTLHDQVREDFRQYVPWVREPRFVCLKCGRVAHDENRLCKPAGLDR